MGTDNKEALFQHSAATLRASRFAQPVLLVFCVASGLGAVTAAETIPQVHVRPAKPQKPCIEASKEAARARSSKEGRPASFYDPTASYEKRFRDALLTNIVEPRSGPPSPDSMVEAELSVNPDGEIVDWRIKRVEGSRDWEAAIIRALQRADLVPLEGDCTVPRSIFLVRFTP